MLKLQLAGGIFIFLFVDTLIDLCNMRTLGPIFGKKFFKLFQAGHFGKWVLNVINKSVEI
jgi:hypothetical protein